ncbi:MAG: rod shape-determining protein MreC [Candidatus Kryptonium sp.]
MLRILSQITQHFKEYLIFSILVLISLLLLFSGNSSKSYLVARIAVELIGFVKHITGVFPNFYDLKDENKELRKTNVLLLSELNQLREEKLENIRLRKLLGFKEKQNNYEFIPADVVGKTLVSPYNYIVLNAGENDGVEVNMPVVCELGVVGKIMKTGKNYSIAMILFHKDFRASVKIQRSRVDGILGWEGGDFLSMMNVSKTMDVEVGDVVITSEYSTIFPAGFEVGVVAGIDNSVPGLFKAIKVKPSVDFTKLEEVFIIKYKSDFEREEIEQASLENKSLK